MVPLKAMTPDQKDQVRSALVQAGVDLDCIDDDDLEKLWVAKYRTVTHLRTVTGESLEKAGLALAIVDAILITAGMPLLMFAPRIK